MGSFLLSGSLLIFPAPPFFGPPSHIFVRWFSFLHVLQVFPHAGHLFCLDSLLLVAFPSTMGPCGFPPHPQHFPFFMPPAIGFCCLPVWRLFDCACVFPWFWVGFPVGFVLWACPLPAP